MSTIRLDAERLEALRKALYAAKIDSLLIDRFIDGSLGICNEACVSGCAACCSSGTANRAAQGMVSQ